ncbi:MAG: hypothetical protein JWL63_2144 [Rhodocyclales bacterium]|nr:hypothetical protein [Rhodocyclales bacterium]
MNVGWGEGSDAQHLSVKNAQRVHHREALGIAALTPTYEIQGVDQ